MALTNAEKVRAYKQRKKEADRIATRPVMLDFRTPFFEFFEDHPNDSEFLQPLEMAGIEPPEFLDDSGPEAFAFDFAIKGLDDPFEGRQRSIGRAEIILEGLLNSARALADMISDYKRRELTARMREIEQSDLSDPEERKTALAEIVRLTKSIEQLDKQVRRTLPEWKIRDDQLP